MPERRPTGYKILDAKSPDKDFELIWVGSGSGVGFGSGSGVGFGSRSSVGFGSGPSDTGVASFGSGFSILGPNGSAVGVGKRAALPRIRPARIGSGPGQSAPLLTRTK